MVVDFILRGNRFGRKSFLATCLSLLLIFGLVSGVLAKPAMANSVRLAVVSSLSGNVTVQKGGGSQVYDAYEGMSLNEGDTVITGADSSAFLNVGEDDAEMTIGPNSEFNVSDLDGQSEGKTSKFKMWAGSMWVKVKSLVGADDEFEIETPTAVMGVRGTHFLEAVDPHTNQTKMIVFAGRILTSTITNENGERQHSKETFVYPMQQISLDARDEVDDLSIKVSMLDLDKLVQDTSPEVLAAIIKNKESIDQENAQFIGNIRDQIAADSAEPEDGSLSIHNLDELNKVTQNLNNLIGNVAKKALQQGKFTQQEMNQIIEATNQQISDPGRFLDLNNVKDLDMSAGMDPLYEKLRLAQLKQLEAEKLQQQAVQKQQLETLMDSLQQFITAIQQQRAAIDKANQAAKQQASDRAAEELSKQLSGSELEQFQKSRGEILDNESSGSSGGNSHNDDDDDHSSAIALTINDQYSYEDQTQNVILTGNAGKAGTLSVTNASTNHAVKELSVPAGPFTVTLPLYEDTAFNFVLMADSLSSPTLTKTVIAKPYIMVPGEIYNTNSAVAGYSYKAGTLVVKNGTVTVQQTPIAKGEFNVTIPDQTADTELTIYLVTGTLESNHITKLVQSAASDSPKAALISTAPDSEGNFDIGLSLEHFLGNNAVYAIELHLLYDTNIYTRKGTDDEVVSTYDANDPIFPLINGALDSNYAVESKTVYPSDESGDTKEFVYIISLYGPNAQPIEVDGLKNLVNLGFKVENGAGRVSIPDNGLIIVNENGSRITPVLETSTKDIPFGNQ